MARTLNVSDFDYHLPEALIAQHPVATREESRLLVLHRDRGTIDHRVFRDITDYLDSKDLLVMNNSRVFPARLLGVRPETGGRVEFLLLRRLGPNQFEALIHLGSRQRTGVNVRFSDHLSGTIHDRVDSDHGTWCVRFNLAGNALDAEIARTGHMPLPPYIKRAGEGPDSNEDMTRYQNVYARVTGSAAAPTAGFHFSEALLAQLAARGVMREEVTLHVGLGTFRPVKVETIDAHVMHHEECEVTEPTAARLNSWRTGGGRVVAVGTTTVRTLESFHDGTALRAGRKDTNIFIYPPYTFKCVDRLITNFHIPKSTLLMLVSAFAGKDLVMHAYEEAVREKYRFFSYGDAMLII